jgi:hypothetical protein
MKTRRKKKLCETPENTSPQVKIKRHDNLCDLTVGVEEVENDFKSGSIGVPDLFKYYHKIMTR